MKTLYLDDNGKPWFVDDAVDGPRGIATDAAPWKPSTVWERQPAANRTTPPDAPRPH
jgi:hypothetical protein